MPFPTARHHVASLRRLARVYHHATTACAIGVALALVAFGVVAWRGSLGLAVMGGVSVTALVTAGLVATEEHARLLETAGLIERSSA